MDLDRSFKRAWRRLLSRLQKPVDFAKMPDSYYEGSFTLDDKRQTALGWITYHVAGREVGLVASIDFRALAANESLSQVEKNILAETFCEQLARLMTYPGARKLDPGTRETPALYVPTFGCAPMAQFGKKLRTGLNSQIDIFFSQQDYCTAPHIPFANLVINAHGPKLRRALPHLMMAMTRMEYWLHHQYAAKGRAFYSKHKLG